MSPPWEWKRLFRLQGTPRQLERNINDEIAFHLEYRKKRLMAQGLSEEEARREAEERFGDAGSVRGELGRIGRTEMRRRRLLDAVGDFGRDIPATARRLVRAPGVARTVVAVIEDGKYSSLSDVPEPYFCIPLSQAPYVQRRFLVAAVEGDPATYLESLQQVLTALDPDLPVPITILEEYLSVSTGIQRFPVYLSGALTLLALLLTLLGIYGISSYLVSKRTPEFGIRIALGARTATIVRVVVWQGLRTALIGLVIGIVASVVAGHVLASFLFGVSPLDPVVFALLPVAAVVVTLLACLVPARWAARINPIEALRVE